MVRVRLQSATGTGSRILLSLFFLIFLAAGIAFTGSIAKQLYSELITYRWDNASCRIESAAVTDQPDRTYSVTANYSYDYQGTTYRSDVYRRSSATSDDLSSVERTVDTLLASGTVPCFVDSDAPQNSVIVRPSPFIALIILFPLIFVVVGGGGVYLMWSTPTATAEKVTPQFKRERLGSQTESRAPAIIFAGLASVGVLIGYFAAFDPLSQYIASWNWRHGECTVISGDVRTHDSDDGTTYSVDIVYRYTIAGREYRSNRYDFGKGSSGGYEGKREIVNRYPAGETFDCFIDPHDPFSAVLVRGLGGTIVLLVVSALFTLVGIGGLRFMLYPRNARSSGIGSSISASSHSARDSRPTSGVQTALGLLTFDPAEQSVPKELRSSGTPLTRFLAILFVAGFWNGIVSVFVWQVFQDYQRGTVDYFLMVFLTPFVLIGLALIAGIFHFFLQIFNPRLTVTLGAGALALGQSTTLSWRCTGRASRMKSLRFTLVGAEEATYRRGTDTRTDKKNFREIELYSTSPGTPLEQGQFSLSMPADTMHSWQGKNNKITWTIKAHGELPRWADLREEYSLTVLPRK